MKTSTRVFNKPLSPQSIWNNISFCPDRATDEQMIKAYQYTKFANALLRYSNLRYHYWETRWNITMGQWANEDAINRLQKEIEKRGLEDPADDYHIDFKAIEKWIGVKKSASQ